MVAQTQPDGSVKRVAEYTGDYLHAEHSPNVYRKTRILAILTAAGTLCACLLLISLKGFSVYNGGLYALIPAVMMLFPAIYLLFGVIRLPAEDRKIQEDVYQFAHSRIRKCTEGIVILCALTVVLALVFLITSGTKPSRMDCLFLALTAGPAAANAVLRREMKGLVYHKSPRRSCGDGEGTAGNAEGAV